MRAVWFSPELDHHKNERLLNRKGDLPKILCMLHYKLFYTFWMICLCNIFNQVSRNYIICFFVCIYFKVKLLLCAVKVCFWVPMINLFAPEIDLSLCPSISFIYVRVSEILFFESTHAVKWLFFIYMFVHTAIYLICKFTHD